MSFSKLQSSNTEGPLTLEWIRSLSKAELHLHLLGAIRPDTALELADHYGKPFPISDPLEWSTQFRTGNLSDFTRAFVNLFEIVHTREDFSRVASEILADLARDGIRYVEPRITWYSHHLRGVDSNALWQGLQEGAEQAYRQHGIETHWIIDFPRFFGREAAEASLQEALARRHEGVVGLDVAGDENHQEDEDRYAAVFTKAKEAGLCITAHVGETQGPASVWRALNDWHVDRLGHALTCTQDSALLAELARRRIPVEVSPSSNLALAGISSLPEHPVRTMVAEGLRVTINSDDPTLLGTTLSEELYYLGKALGWQREDILKVLQTAWESRFAPGD